MTISHHLRAAILARYSSDAQHARSNEDQVRECRAAAARMGFVVQEEWVCTDSAKSGATIHGRAGFQRLVAAARRPAPPFDVILVDDYSRLSREADVAISLFKDLTSRGIRIIGASDGFDSGARGAKLQVMLKGAVGEIYLDDLAEKTHRGQRGQFLRNFHTGGRLYGYRSDPVYASGANPLDPRADPEGYVLRIEPTEADIVGLIFRLYAVDQVSVKEIARRLNASGVPAPSASTERNASPGWSHSSIVARIDNETYAGRFVWNRRDWYRDRESGRRRYVERPKTEWEERIVPDLAIVTEELWRAAQARRAAAKKKFPGFGHRPGLGSLPGRPIRHLFSGLLVCAECGHTMQILGGKGASRSYGCPTNRKGAEFCSNAATVSKAKVERTILDGLRRELHHPDVLARIAKRIARAQGEQSTSPTAEIAKLQAERKRVQEEVERLVTALAGGLADSPSITRHLKDREARMAELEARVAHLKALPRPADILPSPSAVEKLVARLDELLKLDTGLARRFLEQHVGKVTLTPKNEDPKPRYWASGRFFFGPVDPRAEQVAGARW